GSISQPLNPKVEHWTLHSAPLACKDVVRPLVQLDPIHLAGNWALVVGSMNDAAHLERFKTRDSALINFASASETASISFTRNFNLNGTCRYLTSNITLAGSGFSIAEFNITMTFLFTSCPDCLVMRFSEVPEKPLCLYLFSRRRQLEQKEMEEFRAQVEMVEQKEMEEFMAQLKCCGLPEPFVMDPTKELCQEQPESQPTAAAHTEEITVKPKA
uniref:Uncharacterized protein n=1 Tax=Echeneis naucrates TaxID=173247 RepID=A0A665X8X6_ECHNA